MVLKEIGTYNGHWCLAVLEAERLARATKQRWKVSMTTGHPRVFPATKRANSE